MGSNSTIITYQELLEQGATPGFVKEAIERHKASEMYKNARSADSYYRQRNETICNFTRTLFGTDGSRFEDFTASKLKIASNLFKRLNVQRCMYSLGKGVSFVGVGEHGEDTTKAKMGPRFDDDVKKIGLNALIHGISFPFWNLDHIDVFAATEFAPIWDETSGALMAGIRFWRLDATRPLHAVLYEQDGYTAFDAKTGDDLQACPEGKRPYKATYAEVPADGLKLAVDEENYTRLPIIPIWGSDAHQSTLVGLRESVDAYDLIKSGFANTVQDCAEIYWIVENAGGMNDKDLQQLRDRLLLTHMATADTEDGAKVTPYTQEVPYEARKAVLKQLKDDMYEDFGALDVHTVAAGATNDHIDAGYQPMDEEADEFERHIREGIMDLVALQGIVDTPIFTRNRISNTKEQVDIVVEEAEWLDDETILRKLPNITPDEVAEILKRKDEEAADKMAALPPALQANAAGQPADDGEEAEE
ncbi:MAG: phage portal protein [Slackia isoflavoniconvertens]|nr:phage portal protein [Slackia isoflavoniconvertens]